MQALGWRQRLCAFLLTTSLAVVSTDLNSNYAYPDKSRTGLEDDIVDSYESEPDYEAEDQTRKSYMSNHNQGYPTYEELIKQKESMGSLYKDQFREPWFRQDPFVSNDYIHDSDLNNEYPYSAGNITVPISTDNMISRFIPSEEHFFLHNVPGAEKVIQCSREGELYSLWAPGYQCLVCVCLPTYGRLQPICVSCQSCLLPSTPDPTTSRPPPTTRPPSTTTLAPTETPVPDDVSCAPLPVDVPFQSPLDPCKICTCTETHDRSGKKDVKINCHHNPQCVLPTTEHTLVTTPIPDHVCNKFPTNVPFPHPQDSCKTCMCTMEGQVVCHISSECLTTTTPQPVHPTSDLPDPEICNNYPENVLFQHPHDKCQVCKCNVQPGIYHDEKTVTCFFRPDCIPETETPPTPTTDISTFDCKGYPENVHFPHPTDSCQLCVCKKDYNQFIPVVRMTCSIIPDCVPTTTPDPEPPRPNNATCAPLPTDRPFKHPLQPCQLCVCSETTDFINGGTKVTIECKDDPRCVEPPEHTTLLEPPEHTTLLEPPEHTNLSPDFIDQPLPECKYFPENVFFPHPQDPCKLCRCTVQTVHGKQEQVISCIVKSECLPTLPPPPSTEPPPPLAVCGLYPLDTEFEDPNDQCRVCVCSLLHPGSAAPRMMPFPIQILCHIKPECLPTPPPITTSEQPTSVDICGQYPLNTEFEDPNDQCRVCVCSYQQPGSTATRMLPLQLQILCHIKPECFPTQPPTTTTVHPASVDTCDHYPLDHPFEDPNDQCRVCVCTFGPGSSSPVLPHALVVGSKPKVQVICNIKPECLPTPPPTTQNPPTVDICSHYRLNTEFEDPNDQCRICVCTYEKPGSSEPRMLFVPMQLQILCLIKAECVSTPSSSTTTQQPASVDICDHFPLNTEFEDPNDQCRVCVCSYQQPGSAAPRMLPLHLQILCHIKPECLPTPPPTTTTEQPASVEICDHYPLNTPFEDPHDKCRVCVCTYGLPDSSTPAHGHALSMIMPQSRLQIKCKIKPECLPSPPPTTEHPPTVDVCDHYPLNTEFEDPNDHCRVCVCSYQQPGSAATRMLPLHLQILCHIKPECLPTPPPTTSTELPSSIDICGQYPLNTEFEDPNDQCRVCVCSYQQPGSAATRMLPLHLQILCHIKPECLPTPPPITTTEQPASVNLCDHYPLNTPFEDPNDKCRVCVCTYGHPGSSTSALQHALTMMSPQSRIQVICKVKPECLPSPPPTTEHPPTVDICGQYPLNTEFEDPNDQCRVCVCSYQQPGSTSPRMLPLQLQILCHIKPECMPTPPPTTTTEQPASVEICDHYPLNTPFEDPNDKCRVCVCTYEHPGSSTSALQHALTMMSLQSRLQVMCKVKPECLPSPPPTTEHPPTVDICGHFPLNTEFEDPKDQCRVCVCSYQQPGSTSPRMLPLQLQILCHIKPECMPTPPPTTTTEQPASVEICDHYPLNTPFEDPNDKCRVCVCTYGLPGSSTPALQHTMTMMSPKSRLQVMCKVKPECLPPPPPVTDQPDPSSICEHHPVHIPFTDPRDPCRSCVCYYDSPGSPGVNELSHRAPTMLVKCILKPECQPPPSEPQTQAPPTVSCKPLPSGIPFPNPLNPCAICICSETVDALGNDDVIIRCQENPQCVVPSNTTTLPSIETSPVPLAACKEFPTNVLFPHPRDPCRVCKCTVEHSHGAVEQLITCYDSYDNPECASSTTTTPAPWKHDALPGPAPHESCAPFTPHQPFQHPWDECLVCVCREARTNERITVEVNCYTSPSCCYEPPNDAAGITGGAISNTQVIAPVQKQINWNYNQHKLVSPGGHVIGGNNNKGTGNNAILNYYPNDKELNGIGGNGHFIGNYNIGTQQIRFPVNGQVFPSRYPTANAGGNYIGPSGGDFVRPNGAQFRPPTEHMLRPAGFNGNLNPGNVYLPNLANQWHIPVNPKPGPWKLPNLHFSLKPGGWSNANAVTKVMPGHYTNTAPSVAPQSTKMRTKSARPKEDDTEDYD